ncbi:MAG: SPFH domain-containing protein, partial [Crocinitomicaceae bacterium]
AKELFLSRCEQQLRTYFAKAKISYQDIDSELNTISEALKQELNGAFTKLGFIMTDFQITGTAFDDDTEARIDSIADITAENLAATEGGLSYVDLEKLKALRDAAKNEGGLAGAGLQMGVGLEIGKNFSPGNMAAAGAATSATQSAPASPSEKTPVERLTELKTLLDAEIITKEEFEAKKIEILKQI